MKYIYLTVKEEKRWNIMHESYHFYVSFIATEHEVRQNRN